MALIHTCPCNGIHLFASLAAAAHNRAELAKNPGHWSP